MTIRKLFGSTSMSQVFAKDTLTERSSYEEGYEAALDLALRTGIISDETRKKAQAKLNDIDKKLEPLTKRRNALENILILLYGDVGMLVRKDDLAKMLDHCKSLPSATLPHLMASVETALTRAAPAMRSEVYGKEMADEFYGDLMIWDCLKRMAMA